MVSQQIITAAQRIVQQMQAGQYLPPSGQMALEFEQQLWRKIEQATADRRFPTKFVGIDFNGEIAGNQTLRHRSIFRIDYSAAQVALECIIGLYGDDQRFKVMPSPDGTLQPLSSQINEPVKHVVPRPFRFPNLVNKRRRWR